MKIVLATVILSTFGLSTLHAQCSDAGVCVLGASHEAPEHQLGAGYTYGKSGETDGLFFHSIHVEGSFQLLPDSRISIVMPWSRSSGPLGFASGIGDVTILWNQALWDMTDVRVTVQIGGKLATGEVNAGSLPQAYQPGLGTNDLLAGISYEADPMFVALGYQFSRGRSDNSVTRLKRGDDLLARVGYNTRFDDLLLGLQAVAIKRLDRSSVRDNAVSGDNAFMIVPESDQLQVNLMATATFPLSELSVLRGVAALPLLSRSVNVDGLTRSITVSLGMEWNL